jgi:hypothetical protein
LPVPVPVAGREVPGDPAPDLAPLSPYGDVLRDQQAAVGVDLHLAVVREDPLLCGQRRAGRDAGQEHGQGDDGAAAGHQLRNQIVTAGELNVDVRPRRAHLVP